MMAEAAEKASDRKWRVFDTFLAYESAAQQRAAKRLLGDEAHRIADAFESRGEAAAMQAVSEQRWYRFIGQLYLAAVRGAGEATEDAIGAARSDLFDVAVRGWMGRNGQRWAAGLARTSRENARKLIAAGRLENLDTAAIARRLLADLRDIANWRSELIAMTEVHSAAYFGAFTAAVNSHMRLDKVWTAPRHPTRTCDQHLALHGRRVALSDYFAIAADRLMYPGDVELGAAPEQTINCRCSMDYVLLERRRVGG